MSWSFTLRAELLQNQILNWVQQLVCLKPFFFSMIINWFYFYFFQGVKCQGLDLDSLLPDQEMLMKIMVHPLQIQVIDNEGE